MTSAGQCSSRTRRAIPTRTTSIATRATTSDRSHRANELRQKRMATMPQIERTSSSWPDGNAPGTPGMPSPLPDGRRSPDELLGYLAADRHGGHQGKSDECLAMPPGDEEPSSETEPHGDQRVVRRLRDQVPEAGVGDLLVDVHQQLVVERREEAGLDAERQADEADEADDRQDEPWQCSPTVRRSGGGRCCSQGSSDLHGRVRSDGGFLMGGWHPSGSAGRNLPRDRTRHGPADPGGHGGPRPARSRRARRPWPSPGKTVPGSAPTSRSRSIWRRRR